MKDFKLICLLYGTTRSFLLLIAFSFTISVVSLLISPRASSISFSQSRSSSDESSDESSDKSSDESLDESDKSTTSISSEVEKWWNKTSTKENDADR